MELYPYSTSEVLGTCVVRTKSNEAVHIGLCIATGIVIASGIYWLWSRFTE